MQFKYIILIGLAIVAFLALTVEAQNGCPYGNNSANRGRRSRRRSRLSPLSNQGTQNSNSNRNQLPPAELKLDGSQQS